MSCEQTWGTLLSQANDILNAAGIEDSIDDAKYLFCEYFKTNHAGILLNRNRQVPAEETTGYLNWVQRRAEGCPVQYIIGTQCFMGLDFKVTPAVLIPRMDTEVLVDTILNEQPSGSHGADICTGSGCIALSLAKLGGFAMIASDISEQALQIARENAASIDPQVPVQFYQGDLLAALPESLSGQLDFIVSNPPYIPSHEILTLDTNVKDHEPHLALDGGQDGLDFYRRLAVDAQRYLKPGGSLYFEIGCEQGQALRNILEASGMEKIRILQDFGHRDRIAAARKPQ